MSTRTVGMCIRLNKTITFGYGVYFMQVKHLIRTKNQQIGGLQLSQCVTAVLHGIGVTQTVRCKLIFDPGADLDKKKGLAQKK